MKVLDKGYVILQDKLGDDRTIANAARVSYDKKTDELRDRDIGLINFLAREGHTSPFRHAQVQFEVYAPLMVARQWWKYVTGSSHQENQWNESSRRYITEKEEFYNPDYYNRWRNKPESSKQGSGETVDDDLGLEMHSLLKDHINEGVKLYRNAMKQGIAPEQARLFLPAYAMYVRWYWTASLQSVAHFIQQRDAWDAQQEIREYAKAVKELTLSQYPIALPALIKGDD